MKILESEFSEQITKFVENEVGYIYFFNHIAVVEINEGVHLDINNAPKIINELNKYFKETMPYGVVANRINSYSVNLVHVPLIRKMAKNLYAYGVVGHDLAGKMNAAIENDFCKADKVEYDSLFDAVNSIYNKVQSNSFYSTK
ncbi:hypothetical protein FPF71_07520 [Algibacter amylolyticus]|uniref:Uncharacterized protein n=1 Tax=Algibacter amylolyticus TaxID=1608400 RepID=A0A5M7BAP3_9FLAO|nr:hypothetical protein [Algibacter amylolyticus]KAA5825750.1 hypothetical protein F2B50_07520 [Algibacter amylolyticus]MBB5268015.1 hypothetical protein [Algibacter amylolyticus]TSJ80048.1 hypothetical protein FPF71_07520 [Algibacter amylolyticus]